MQERRVRPLSRTLSREELVDRPDTVKRFSKPLNRLFHILNKKLRTIRYVFFVKLETLKKLNLKIEPEEGSSPADSPV